MMEPRVSVVLPVFGGHRAARVLAAVCRAWLGQDVPCEIAKLDSRARVLRAWRVARELTCLHFEHPRTHTAVSFPGNHAILDERRSAGAEAMIAEDLASAGVAP
jgi:hypothetical protein